jgi:hypothetical protein
MVQKKGFANVIKQDFVGKMFYPPPWAPNVPGPPISLIGPGYSQLNLVPLTLNRIGQNIAFIQLVKISQFELILNSA